LITSKDDATTASLLGFAIANRVDSVPTAKDEPSEPNTKSSAKAVNKEEVREAKKAAEEKANH
jgi:hypothetical protein